MGTAIFTGVNGLLVQQRKLDVTAANIANVNTTGYRRARVQFQDLFSQTIRGGSAPVGNFGGANPQQVGLGVQIASIDTSFQQGALNNTGIASDLAIQGAGFFILSDGVTSNFSRDGSFSLNNNGELIDPATGQKVQGFLADDTGTIQVGTQPQDIVIPVGGTSIVRATTQTTLSGNLDASSAAGDTVERSLVVFDSLGIEREVILSFTKTANPNEWNWSAAYNDGSADPLLFPNVGSGTFTFGPEGALPQPPATPTTGTISISAADLGIPPGEAQPTTPFDFTVDFTAVTQLAVDEGESSDVSLRTQDGFARGVLESFNIGGNGEINGVFTNGLTRTIAQVAIATFSNEGALERDGNNLFRETPGSGVAQVGSPNSGGRGAVLGGVLENSNVDLGSEFSNLIVTQRSFQANARTITTADTVLQETINLIR